MNPYVYRRKVLNLSKTRKVGWRDVAGLFKLAFTSQTSSAIALAMVVFAASSVGILTTVAHNEIASGVYDPVIRAVRTIKTPKASVLGTQTQADYPEVVVTSQGNRVVTIKAKPVEYSDSQWTYRISWNRTRNAQGSIYLNGTVLKATAEQQGSAEAQFPPKTKVKVEFYSQPNKKGILLVRKYFVTLPAEASVVACTQEVKLCPDGKTYVSRTGPKCEFSACPVPIGLTDGSAGSGVSFRYLKVQTVVSRSWVAWREIEAYDASGNKLTPVDATAQYTWRNYPFDGQDHGPKLAIDGNTDTVWNAGETAPNCNWFGTSAADRMGCGVGNQSAWIQVDFGSIKDVSKIRLLTENTPNPAAADHVLYISSDGQNYTKLYEFKGDIKSNTWLEFPEKQPLAVCDYAAPPARCEYIKGPNYNEQTACGLVLKCSSTEGTNNSNTSPGGATSTSTPGGTQNGSVAASVSVRYIKDSITKSGWVAIREMEFYGPDGGKLIPTGASASCDWCNYGTPPSYSVGAKGSIDGDTQKVWNAGETADNCSWYVLHTRNDGIYGYGCAAWTVRKAWLQVDFGTTVKVSKIRILPMGESTDRVDELSGSTDGQIYFTIGSLKASTANPVSDDKWIEYMVK